MRKLLLSIALLLFAGNFLYSQISSGGIPPSFKFGINTSIDRVEIQPMSLKNVFEEIDKFPKDGHIPVIGYSLFTDLSPENSGTWSDLPDGSRIWQLQIKSPGALSIGVYYDSFTLPIGGKLFLYNEDKTQVIGAFTYDNNNESGLFANEMIYGDIVNIEYWEPVKTLAPPEFHINEIAYFFRGVKNMKNPSWTEPSEACEVNINCTPVGDNWQDEKRGVSRILVKEGTLYGYCTGSLINNANQNCTAYYLTAYHCKGNASASDLNQWIFYFNYESSGCTTPTTEPSYNSMTGCSLKAGGNISGGSDFVLLQLNQSVPTSYNPFMNGWNRNNAVTGPGASIHHPSGSIKKISTFNSATTSTWSGGASNAHWRVVWVANSNGHGVTEGGSSGSPLFDASGRIVGTLTGGSSYCTQQSSPDYYGKFYYHWDLNGSTAAARLKDWLDPANTGITTLDGKWCNGTSGPIANFTGNPTTVQPGGQVVFTNQSTGTITSYNWSFPGGTPSAATGVGPHTITYNTVGVYNASLTVSDGTTPNTLTRTNYITVSDCQVTGYALDFECNADFDLTFTPWTVNDVDQLGTYAIQNVTFPHQNEAMAYIAFNNQSTTPAVTNPAPHGGVRFGACFASVPSGGLINNDWLISPKVQLGTNSSFTLWVKSHTDQYGLERFKIGVSTTNNTPASFTIISSGTYETAPITWTQKTYSLASYNNQQVYVGINCVSSDAFIFMVDDIVINTTLVSINSVPNVSYINLFPNPATGYAYVDYSSVKSENVEILIYDLFGRLMENVTSANETSSIKKLDISSLNKGVYIVKIVTPLGEKIEKFTVY